MSPPSQFRRHLQFQSGCYLDLADLTLPAARARSSRITDVGWNYVYAEDPSAAIAALQDAASDMRELFYSSLEERERFVKAFPGSSVHQETWLQRRVPIRGASRQARPFSALVAHDGPVPTTDFLNVFDGVLADLGVSSDDVVSFQQQYGSSLRSAKAVAGVSVRHLVGYVNSNPVACASIYFDSEYACLYNVGTAVHSKNRGYGSSVSALAVDLAFDLGVQQVFLQCASGGYVEKMYRDLGFDPISDGTGFIAVAR